MSGDKQPIVRPWVAAVVGVLGLLWVLAFFLGRTTEEIDRDPAPAIQPLDGSPTGEFTYLNLAGEPVTIRETNSTGFTGGVPGPISAIDLFRANSGCSGIRTELDFWLSMLDDPDVGGRASVYARYALDVGAQDGCDLSP